MQNEKQKKLDMNISRELFLGVQGTRRKWSGQREGKWGRVLWKYIVCMYEKIIMKAI
jgi:hypothetical protein